MTGMPCEVLMFTERLQSVGMTDFGLTTEAVLTWPGGQQASIRCSFVEPEMQRLELAGRSGRLVLDGDAHTGGPRATVIGHVDGAGDRHEIEVAGGDPYLGMIEQFAAAVRGTAEWPRPVERSIEMLALLDRIRETTR